MPTPIAEALHDQEDFAVKKAAELRRTPARYAVSAALAGAYIGVAIVLLIMVSAPMLAGGSPWTKLVQGSVFGVALTLVVFAGAELFTGNNMVMVQGLFARRVSAGQLLGVWGASLAGNLAGSIGFAALVNAAGIINTGAAPGKVPPAKAALTSIAASKGALTGGQIFFRAVLCNFLVCLAMWMAARATTDSAKLICLFWALLAFVASGFEHSVANMTLLGLAALTGVGHWSGLWRNLVWSVPGNVVGGALLVGAAYGWIGRPAPAIGATSRWSLGGVVSSRPAPVAEGAALTSNGPSSDGALVASAGEVVSG